MTNTFSIEATNLSALLSRFASIPLGVQKAMETVLAEEIISIQDDFRGPIPDKPGGNKPGRIGPSGVQNKNAPGLGLIPVNSGTLIGAFEFVPRGLSVKMTNDAQVKKSGFFYAPVAHFAGEDPGQMVELATKRWETFGERASAQMEQILTDHLGGQ